MQIKAARANEKQLGLEFTLFCYFLHKDGIKKKGKHNNVCETKVTSQRNIQKYKNQGFFFKEKSHKIRAFCETFLAKRSITH